MNPAPTASFWTIGWRALLRDWRTGELHVLVLAIALAVAALSAVGFFADRLQGAQIDKRTRGWDKPSDHVPVIARFALD